MTYVPISIKNPTQLCKPTVNNGIKYWNLCNGWNTLCIVKNILCIIKNIIILWMSVFIVKRRSNSNTLDVIYSRRVQKCLFQCSSKLWALYQNDCTQISLLIWPLFAVMKCNTRTILPSNRFSYWCKHNGANFYFLFIIYNHFSKCLEFIFPIPCIQINLSVVATL